jgi:hypothetical protein
MLAGDWGLKNKKINVFCTSFLVVLACLLIFSVSSAWATEVVNTGDDLAESSAEKSMPVMVYIHPTPDVIITPEHTGEGSPGETLNYTHLIANKGNISDTFDITYTSSLGWTYEFYTDLDGDGIYETKLKDTDGDGIIDTGMVDQCGEIKILKRVTIPLKAVIGTEDIMVMTVKSSLDSTVKDEAKNCTKVIPPFITFGPPTPIAPIGVLPYTGAVLLPLILCGGMLIGAGAPISRRYRILILPR